MDLFDKEYKSKPIEERQADFHNVVWIAAGGNYLNYSKEVLRDFYDWWSEFNPDERKPKMRWEKERDKPRGIFNLKQRLNRFKRKQRNGNKRNTKGSITDEQANYLANRDDI